MKLITLAKSEGAPSPMLSATRAIAVSKRSFCSRVSSKVTTLSKLLRLYCEGSFGVPLPSARACLAAACDASVAPSFDRATPQHRVQRSCSYWDLHHSKSESSLELPRQCSNSVVNLSPSHLLLSNLLTRSSLSKEPMPTEFRDEPFLL